MSIDGSSRSKPWPKRSRPRRQTNYHCTTTDDKYGKRSALHHLYSPGDTTHHKLNGRLLEKTQCRLHTHPPGVLTTAGDSNKSPSFLCSTKFYRESNRGSPAR